MRCGIELLAEADGIGARRCEQLLQYRAPRLQWRTAQITLAKVGQIEQVQHDLVRPMRVERLLQRAEIRDARLVGNHDLPVVPARWQLEAVEGALQRQELGCPVMTVARQKARACSVVAHQHAIAIELDFIQPLLDVRRRACTQRGQLRRQRAGQYSGHGLGRPVVTRYRATAFHGGGSARRRAQGLHAVRQLVDQAVLGGWAGRCVLLLHQQPRHLLFALALHAHQHPAAMQLVAMQLELQVAVSNPLLRVMQRSPRSGVPHNDLACAVLLGGNGSFELCIGQWVVLDLHSHALDARVQAGPLGHGPTL